MNALWYKRKKKAEYHSTKTEHNIYCHWPQRHVTHDVILASFQSPSHGPQNSQCPYTHQYCSKCYYLKQFMCEVRDRSEIPHSFLNFQCSNVPQGPVLLDCISDLKHFHLQWRIPLRKTKTKR